MCKLVSLVSSLYLPRGNNSVLNFTLPRKTLLSISLLLSIIKETLMILIFLMITVFETCRFSHNAFTGCRGSKNINTDLNFRRRSKLATLSLERTFLST